VDALELGWEVMGYIALAIFWIHTLLIAGAAVLDLRDLAGLARRLRPLAGTPSAGAVGLLEGRLIEGRGPEGAVARNLVDQVGRSRGDGKVHFSDAAHRSEIFGGALELDDGTRVALSSGAEDQAAVWPAEGARERAAAPDSPAAIEEVIPAAKRGSGWRRGVDLRLSAGERAWASGRVEQREDGELALIADAEVPLLIAARDPRAWLRRRRLLVWAFILGELAVAGLCTTLALWPPRFELISMIGAAGALGFFLGVQPLGVAVHDAVRTPDRAYLRGTWSL
jgi:hypothetical protein